MVKILVLFSGTGSIEKVFDEEEHEIRGLDLDNTFEPFYNVDILEWEYKDILSEWMPDFIHGSPVCKEFSNLKVGRNRDMDLGMSLLTKCLEIIEFVKSINPNLKYTIENPKGLMRKQECMKPYKRFTCSYCMYGFKYMKPTDFWSNMDLDLRLCRRTKNEDNWCESMKTNPLHRGKHYVRIGYCDKGKQIGDATHFKELRQTEEYKDKKYSNTYFRYRIPRELCEYIRDCVLENN